MCICFEFHCFTIDNETTDDGENCGMDGVINQVLEYVDNVELIKERLTNEQILERKSSNSNHKILPIVYMNLQDIFDVLD